MSYYNNYYNYFKLTHVMECNDLHFLFHTLKLIATFFFSLSVSCTYAVPFILCAIIHAGYSEIS